MMMKAITFLATSASQAQKVALEQRTRSREKRFNIQRTVPKVAADSLMGLVDELDYFETGFYKTQPSSATDWAMTLGESLVGNAKTWRDFAILPELGKTLSSSGR